MANVVEKGTRTGPSTAVEEACHLTLIVRTPGMVRELMAYPEGDLRDAYAMNALRIGIIALKQAQGRIDGDLVRSEGDRILRSLEQHLQNHKATVQDNVKTVLKEYFDPQSGRFNERVRHLVKDGGELEQLIRAQIGQTDSELARTLAAHFGPSSPLMKVLSPTESEGVVLGLSGAVNEALRQQSRSILAEFSLDNERGALARLVKELKAKHGELATELQSKVNVVVGEFSLDNEDSALSKLVSRMEAAQQKINNEFSLDEDHSALARMKRELEGLIERHNKANEQFRNDVRESLAAIQARRSEAQKTTRHGIEFEGEVVAFVERECALVGDVVERTGAKPGLIKNCKVGDAVVSIGPEREASGARMVVEAKQEAGFDLAAVLDELKTARKNRDASVGLFVYSRLVAPEGLPPLSRYGNDVVVIWDIEDTMTDVYLAAALSVCRALSFRTAVVKPESKVDLDRMQREIFELEKQVEALDEIRRSAGSIRSSADKIEERGRIVAQVLERSARILTDEVAALREREKGQVEGGKGAATVA